MSAAIAAASAAVLSNRTSVTRSSSSVENSHRYNDQLYRAHSAPELYRRPVIGRYESQKRRDWNDFVQYLKKRHRLSSRVSFCSGADVVEFLRDLNQTKFHASSCPYSDHSQPPPPPCSCPLPGSADALIRRLQVAFEENGGPPATNPFCSSAVRLYMEELKGFQAKTENTTQA